MILFLESHSCGNHCPYKRKVKKKKNKYSAQNETFFHANMPSDIIEGRESIGNMVYI